MNYNEFNIPLENHPRPLKLTVVPRFNGRHDVRDLTLSKDSLGYMS